MAKACLCLYCGKVFESKKLGRPPNFCSGKCRSLFWKQNNRIKANAHNAIYKAKKKGKLQSGLFCEVCGAAFPADRHHPDYKKPLKTLQVCKKCHHKLKKKVGCDAHFTLLRKVPSLRGPGPFLKG